MLVRAGGPEWRWNFHRGHEASKMGPAVADEAHGHPGCQRLAMAIEIECSLRYQLEMSSRTVSWLIYCTSTFVTLVVAER
jgi:hypothetical protein